MVPMAVLLPVDAAAVDAPAGLLHGTVIAAAEEAHLG